MNIPSRLSFSAILTLLGCLDEFQLPPTTDAGTTGGGPSISSCGVLDSPCCAAREPACDTGLRCDSDSNLCVDEQPRLCTGEEHCHPDQTCCLGGLLGTCLSLPPGGECPTPDLAIVTTQETLALSIEQRIFSPETSPADACALEKGCIRAGGLRQLLRFSIEVENRGDADLLIGDPETSPKFITATCDGGRYLPNYLSYELNDIEGRTVAEGHAAARCQALPTAFSARFNCEFWGLWSGFSETFSPTVTADPTDPDGVDCQWIDVTGLPEGVYVLHVTIDPAQDLHEAAGGNQRDFNVTLPALDEPTRPCPPIPDGAAAPTGGDALFSDGIRRECGWSLVPATLANSCTPGEAVTLACPTCSELTEDPMLRVCEGAEPCLAMAALAAGDNTSVFFDQATFMEAEYLSEAECLARLEVDPFRYSCNFGGYCPTVQFTCPPSGVYTAFSAAALPNASASCDATPQLEPAPDAG